MNIKKLKEEVKEKARLYKEQLQSKTGDHYLIEAHLGMKKIEFSIKGKQMNVGLYIEVNYVRGEWMMCSIERFKSNNWYSSQGIYDEEGASKLIELAVEYFKGYAKFKKINGVFFNFAKYFDETYEKILLNYLYSSGFEKINGDILTGVDYRNTNLFGFFLYEGKEKFGKMELLKEELDVLHQEIPLFVIEKQFQNIPVESAYIIDYRYYYYEGERFSIKLLSDYRIVFYGKEMEEKEYVIEKGVARKILNEVEEYKRLYNLIEVPTKFTGEALEELNIYKKKYQEVVNRCDALLGRGSTEHDMKIIGEVAKSINDKSFYSNKIKLEEDYLYEAYETDGSFTIYRIKADFAIWFIVNYKTVDYFVFPTDKKEVPHEVLTFIFNIMGNDIQKKFK